MAEKLKSNVYEQIYRMIKHRKFKKIMIPATVILSVTVAVIVALIMMKPAITVTKDNPELSVEYTNVELGEILPLTVRACGDEYNSCFTLTFFGNGAGLSEEYIFENEKTELADNNGNTIILNREIGGDGAVNYYFNLEPGRQTEFELNCVSGVFVTSASDEEFSAQLTTLDENGEEILFSEEEIADIKRSELDAKTAALESATLDITPGCGADFEAAKLDTVNRETMNLQWSKPEYSAEAEDSGISLFSAQKVEVLDGGSLKDPTTGEDSGLTWSFTKNYGQSGTLVISGNGDMPDYTYANYQTAPWFKYRTTIGTIKIDEGITSIGNHSLRDTAVTKIQFSSTVESIDGCAFYGSSNITEIEIPGNVKTIGSHAFSLCYKLSNLILTEGLEKISGFVATSVNELYLPSTVNTISNFYDVNMNIVNFKISEDNPVFFSSDGIIFKYLTDGTSQLFLYPRNKSGDEYVIPDFVSSIAGSAFRNNSYLKKVIIPSNVTTFNNEYVFYYASALEEVVFEEGVKIGGSVSNTFSGCPNLKRVVIPDDAYSDNTNAYFFRFTGCSALEEIYVPSGPKTWLGLFGSAFSSFGSSSPKENLKKVYYNVKGLSTTWFQEGSKTINKYELTIGKSVDRLYSKPGQSTGDNSFTFKQVVLINAGSVLFDGENQITIDEGVFDEMPAPLNALAGTVWVDSQGVVYEYDSETLTASVAYVPFGLESVTIPETITPEAGVTCTVNAVDTYAFRLAEDLKTLTFENPAAIESIGTYGIAYCSKLSSVNGETTVDDATALFTNENISIGYRPFFNTALGNKSGSGADMDFIDGLKELEISSGDAQPMYISIVDEYGSKWNSATNIGRYETLTGDVLSINMSVGGSDIQTKNIYRVYFETSELDASTSISPGDTVTLNGTEVTCYATDAPNIIYVEFVPAAGTTVNAAVEVSYPSPSSSGGNLKVWAVIMTPEESQTNQGKIIESETIEATESTQAYSKALQAYWTTQPEEFGVTKTSTGNTTVSLTGDGNGGVVAGSDLSYSISYKRVSDETISYGKDYVRSADFYDNIDFSTCEGISWSSEVLEAVQNGNTRYSGGTFYANNVAIAKVINSGAALSGGSVEYDAEKGVVLHWRIYNSKSNAQIAATTTTLTVYKSALNIDSSILNDAAGTTYEFTNNVEAVTHYTYSDDQKASGSALKYFKITGGNVAISKTTTSSNGYLGGTVNYTIRLYNSGAMPYMGDENAVYTVYDVLDDKKDKSYITPDNMERMFGDEYGKSLTIKITNAVLSEWIEVKSADGGTAYINAANTDDIESTTDTLTISWNDAKTALCVKKSDGTLYEVTESLDKTLKSIGYTIAKNTRFETTWTLNDENSRFSLAGGENRYFYIYSSHKDTFQMLDNDYPTCYPVEKTTNYSKNVAYFKSNGAYFKNSGAAFANMTREAYIYKSAYLNSTGEELTNGNVQLGDILDYTVEFDHLGNGSYENLPLVDELYGSQVLLVPAEQNTSLADSGLDTVTLTENDVEVAYYKLSKPGSYSGLIVGVDESGNYLIADSVTVTAASDPTETTVGEETHSYTGLHTKMKLYYAQTEADYYYSELNYHTIVDPDRIHSTSYSIGGIAYMNDKTKDRIYTSMWGSYSLMDFNKEIVTKNDDGSYTADDDNYTVVGAGDSVTYRLTFTNPNTYALTLGGNNFYDALPFTDSVFEWQKGVNTTISYEATDGVALTDFDSWQISDEIYGAVSSGMYYIKWSSGTKITIDPGKRFSFYVTLTFPTDGDESTTYSDYCEAINGNRIENSLYVYGIRKTVYHSLKEKGRVLLQKGVYATYRHTNNTYKQTAGRIYYNNADNTGRAVSYYVVLYNDGNSRLYLQDIYDVPPQGFTYSKMMSGSTVSSSSLNTITTATSNAFSVLTPSDPDDSVKYKAATVSATTADGVIKFSVSGSWGASAIKYDEFEDKYYLDRGEAIVFGYVCNIGSTSKTTDTALNTVGMEYYDYLGAGVSAVSKNDVPVEGKITTLYDHRNDGTRSVKNAEDIRDTYSFAENSNDGEKWLMSDVAVIRGGIVPGVTCYTDSYINSGSTASEPYETSVSPYATINWRARLHNSGMNAITDYTFIDTLPSPYGLVGTVSAKIYDSTGTSPIASYNIFKVTDRSEDGTSITIQANGMIYTLTLDGTPKTITIATGITADVSVTRNENGEETLKINFSDKVFSIPENDGYVDVTLSSKNVTSVYENTVYTNYAYLKPNVQEYDTTAQGSLIHDGGVVGGVVNTSPVTVSTGFSTSSLKSVEEISVSDNSTDSSADKKYIVLGSKNSTFKYTLSVTNDTSFGMTKLILIDSLPQPGDHSPFDNNAARLSEYKVSLADDPQFALTVITESGDSYSLDSQYYSVECSYSQDFTADDWSGTSQWDEWTADKNDVRSIRLNFNDDSGTQIPPKSRIEFSFNANANDSSITPGMTAWNSFGYHYGLTGITYELEAMPLEVGVKIPDVPVLHKSLINLLGNEYKAEQAATFTFMLYSGNEIEGSFNTSDELIAQLDAEGRTYKQIELSVEQGKSASEKLKLELEGWQWNPGDSYTIAEIQNQQDYKLGGWNNPSSKAVTFTYNPDTSTALNCTNIWQKWSVNIHKIDGTHSDTLLAGAVFAVYSPNSDDLIADEAYSALFFKPEKTVEDSDGIIWFLCKIAVTDENGNAEFTELPRKKYLLAEVKAPDGYKLDWKSRVIDSSYMSSPLVIQNFTMTELPYTGGVDIGLCVTIGTLIATASLFLIVFRWRKQRYKSLKIE